MRNLRLRITVLAAALSLTVTFNLLAGGVVTNCTQADLRQALSGGGQVRFECDGQIALTDTLVITNDTSFDATGHSVALSGGLSVRLFQVEPGVSLTLTHLVLADGTARGTNSTVADAAGGTGRGGALWNRGGTLGATDCIFSNNAALGGTGGPGVNGLGSNRGGPGLGGAIFNERGVLQFTNVLFTLNLAQGGKGGSAPPAAPSHGGYGGLSQGGAIFTRTGMVAVASCRFFSNAAPASVPGPANGYYPSSGPAYGGAFYDNWGTNWIADTTFESQYVGGGAWFCHPYGGALFQAAGSLTLLRCSFLTNQACGGSGIIIGSGSNAGDADGGALCLTGIGTGEQGQTRNFCQAFVAGSSFVGNRAQGGTQGLAVGTAGYGRGGAIENAAKLELMNCTLAANVSRGGDISYPSYPLSSAYGGALLNYETSILTHVTLAFNRCILGAGAGSPSAALGAGIYVSSPHGAVFIRNSILATNLPANSYGTLTDQGGNLCSDDSCAFLEPGSRDNIDPMLLPLDFYGEAGMSLPLRPGSPAIDAAIPAFCPADDQWGGPRPQGVAGDSGALEGSAMTIQRTAEGWQLTQLGAPDARYLLQSSQGDFAWLDLTNSVADGSGRVKFTLPAEVGPVTSFYRTLKLTTRQ